MTGESPGRGLVRSHLAVGNVAIARDQRSHGGFTARAIADDIIDGRATENHRAPLAATPVLAENTATALLHRWRGTWAPEGGLPVIALALPGGTVRLPLPGPRQLTEGRFVMPPAQAQVIAARDALLDRVMDYEFGADPDPVLLSALLN